MIDVRVAVVCLRSVFSLAAAALGSLVFVGCGLIPQKVAYNDPEVQELLRARDVAGAQGYGFSPVPASAEIRIERTSRWGYDRMLHVDGPTHRDIAFRKAESGYVWIGESEMFEGPNEYTSVEGISREHITLTYHLEPLSGHPTKTLVIDYRGEDPRLRGDATDRVAGRPDLTLEVVSPILREWGYALR